MDVRVARAALNRRQIEDGEFYSMDELARAVGCHRSTVSRWFSGSRAGLRMTLAILNRLQLRFDEVYRQIDDPPG
jgi:transcriptional regulator with XRE-family HTH domain